MPKRIRQNEDLYIAPDILGKYRSGRYIAVDERNNNRVLEPNDIDNKIIIYERQVKEWFLNRASKLMRGKYNGFIVLMICMSYLEGVEQYIQGQSSNRNSNRMFRISLERIYPEQFTENNLSRLYNQSRVGLFHDGMVRGDIIISAYFDNPIEFTDQDIKINPRRLLIDIKKDFKNYISKLKDVNNIEMRNNFHQMFSVIPY